MGALVAAGCVDEDGMPLPDDGIVDGGTDSGDGDSGDGDSGDGDSAGDGDTGDGDTDTTTGDGDGDTTGGSGCDTPSPYMGGWDIGCCQDDIVPTGWSPGNVGQGSVLPDWTFNDQFGDQVRVWDFCHDAIYFEYVALW